LVAPGTARTIADELRNVLSEAVDALRPILPGEVTDKDVVRDSGELDGEEE
jgi:hypothetical protein